jgi:hypothetical protein
MQRKRVKQGKVNPASSLKMEPAYCIAPNVEYPDSFHPSASIGSNVLSTKAFFGTFGIRVTRAGCPTSRT